MAHLPVFEEYFEPLPDYHDLAINRFFSQSVSEIPASIPWGTWSLNPPVGEMQTVFKVKLKLREYKPEAITIRPGGNRNDPYLIIEGQRKEKNGDFSIEFVNRCPLPRGIKVQDFFKEVSPNGVATFSATKKVQLPLRDYKPEEIAIRPGGDINDPYRIIEGQKKETNEVFSEFLNRYPLPRGINAEDFVKESSAQRRRYLQFF